MGKYASKSMRPIHKFHSKNLSCDYILIIQETDKKYLIRPIFNSKLTPILGGKTWKMKNLIDLQDKIGEIVVSGWNDEIKGGDQALFDVINKTLSDQNDDYEEVEIKEIKEIKNEDFETCKHCGYVGNSMRDDGIVRCENCGVYYSVTVN